jgi:hypothetical protein
MVPGSLGCVKDTENHILMTEEARYLKNQWLYERGGPDQRGNILYDNEHNGLGVWLLGYLREIENATFHEFNSVPYLSFSFRALLNLDAFAASKDISLTARYILDKANFQYALGSLDLRRCAPFRRQSYRAHMTDLRNDEHTPFMRIWASDESAPVSLEHLSDRESIVAEVMPYRLPDAVREWALRKPERYFVRMGHGPAASPEIYSGGPGYLLSAGGVNRGYRSDIAARPISLLLNDNATDLRECFSLRGKDHWMLWNNTGVCDLFACANGAAHIPEGRNPAATLGKWNVFDVPETPGLFVALCEANGVSLLALFPEWKETPRQLAEALAASNPDEAVLVHVFHRPGGMTVEYDVNAPKGKWPITAIDGKPADRNYDQWPQMEGSGPRITFARS